MLQSPSPTERPGMMPLPKSTLRDLLRYRQSVEALARTVVLQMQTDDVGNTWRENLERIRVTRQRVKELVSDADFDNLVAEPTVCYPRGYTYSASGTMLNVVTCANELIAYIDTVLWLHVPSKTQEPGRGDQMTDAKPTGIAGINITAGGEARVNVFSEDRSINIRRPDAETFAKLRLLLEKHVKDERKKESLLKKTEEMEAACGGREFLPRLNDFMAVAADYMTVLAPILPGLVSLIRSD